MMISMTTHWRDHISRNTTDAYFYHPFFSPMRAWGKKMRTLQDDCFDKQSDKSCRLMNRELGKASELFSELAQATKTASQDALGLLSSGAASGGSKMQGIGMAGLALTLLMPTRKVDESSNSSDFL